MKVLKKIVKVTLALLTSFVLFSCKEDKNQLTKIELWYTPSQTEAGAPPPHWFFYKRLRNELGIELVLRELPSDAKELTDIITQAAKSNSLPDIFKCSKALVVELAKQNKIATVDKMFPLMPQRSKIVHTPEARKSAQIDGLTFALTYPTSNTATPKNEGVLIRKDWLDKLGLSVPKTIDEFFRVMEEFTFNDPDGNGKQDTYGYGAYIEQNVQEDGLGKRFNPLFGAFGVCGTLDYNSKKMQANIRKENYYEAMEFVRKMTTSRVIDPNWSAYKKDDFRNAWKNGRFGIMREQVGAYSMKSNYQLFDKNFPNGEWIVIDPPVGKNGESAVGINTPSFNYLAISKRSSELGKVPKIAQMLEWMFTNAYEDLWYGEKNENYIVTPDGKISDKVSDPIRAYTSKESQNLLQLRWLVDRYDTKQLRERYPLWNRANGKEMDTLKVLAEMQSKPWIDGFSFDKMDDNLQKLYRTGIKEFILGKRNLTKENWNAFVKELDTNGLKEWENSVIFKARTEGFIK